MVNPQQVVYAAFLRNIRSFQQQAIPLTGIVGTDLTFWNLDPVAYIAALLRQPGPVRFEDGVKLLPTVNAQLNTLINAEQHTREALTEWNELALNFGPRHTASPFTAALAAERGMELVSSQIESVQDPVAHFLAASNEEDEDYNGREPASLDELAALVQQQHPQLLKPGDSQAHIDSNESSVIQDRLQALGEVLYKDYKLKYTPFEWVYDGMSPAIMNDVLVKRRGAPGALAVIAAAVARRAGLPLAPFPLLTDTAAATTALGNAAGEVDPALDLPPELALRLSNRTQALGPDPSPWLLTVPTTDTNTSSSELYMDASNGDVLTPEEVVERYPGCTQVIEGKGGKIQLLAGHGPHTSPLVGWRGLVRLVLQAHQRRGESDLVAHWLYVMLALDTSAPEWKTMLEGTELEKSM